MQKTDKRMNLYYSPKAFLKEYALVRGYSTEVAWSMTVVPYKDGYKIDDVFVYPQEVYSYYVHVDINKWAMWKAELPDEVSDHLFGDGHSHVDISAFPSPFDMERRRREIEQKGKGYFLYQICNKQGETTFEFYDIDQGLIYDDDHINIKMELGGETEEEFLSRVFDLISFGKDGNINEFE